MNRRVPARLPVFGSIAIWEGLEMELCPKITVRSFSLFVQAPFFFSPEKIDDCGRACGQLRLNHSTQCERKKCEKKPDIHRYPRSYPTQSDQLRSWMVLDGGWCWCFCFFLGRSSISRHHGSQLMEMIARVIFIVSLKKILFCIRGHHSH